MALGARLDRKKWYTFCLLSDGELEEGNTWEAFMFAGKNCLHELTAIVDRNNIQIDGHTEDIMPLEPLVEKFESFNWAVLEINGHDFSAIQEACAAAKRNTNKPTVIIAHTIPGKGVEFMENKYEWHGKPPTQEEGERALANLNDIRTLGGRINAGHGE
jgi:transketolase